ncbi:hypothetical protein TD95_005280, partial [Thielaviopsis punctulata]
MTETDQFVPTASSLQDIYPPDAVLAQAPRWSNLVDTFSASFGHAPHAIARSPGRVNLIGEHIDYSLYSVLPTALTLDILVAVSAIPSADARTHFSLHNTNPAFTARSFALFPPDVPIDPAVPDWANYVKAGIRGALQLHPAAAPLHIHMLIDGSVPAGGGLSSSAALVLASALAVLRIRAPHLAIDKAALTQLAIASERSVGVNSGGMDQAASVFARPDSVLHVRFAPALAAQPVRMPAGLAVLVVHSGVVSRKHVAAGRQYNLRVVECSLAAAVLQAAENGGAEMDTDTSPLGVSLGGFHEAYGRTRGDFSALSERAQLCVLEDVARRRLDSEEGYTRAEVARLLGVTVAQLEMRFLEAFPVDAERFKLQQRAVHVFSEAQRVLEFVELLRAAEQEAEVETAGLAAQLGALMDASQASCRDLYECSHPCLDEICAIARRNGAVGSRLTGA